jgi:two-component system CheB/CheR fusion protein
MSVNVLQLDDNFVLNIILTDLTDQKENQERLARKTDQLELKNQELEIANKELAFQLCENEKRRAELRIIKTDVKELEGLNTHKEGIISTLSHDLRSPLTGIIGLTELLKESFESLDNSQVKEMLDLLYESSTDELKMLDYLVEWARIKYASEAFNPEKIDLEEYVINCFKTLNEIAVKKNIHLHYSLEEKLEVFTDGRMLISILQNIISNSIKHSCNDGEVFVSAKKNEDKIVVSVKDSGIGMSKDKIEKLFIPQLVSLSKAALEDKGAGIGLLIVKGFIDKNDGRIWVESTEGEGSTFNFTLPSEKPTNLKVEPPGERILRRAK